MDVTALEGLLRQGLSRRQIARMLGMSRNTLKKHLDKLQGGSLPSRAGKLEDFHAELGRALSEDPQARAMSLFQGLRARGYQGSYDLVKRKVRSLRREAAASSRSPAPEPGARAEADLGKVRALDRDFFLFTLTLGHSGRIYAELMDGVDMDAFLECHRRAFEYFQGVPREVAYERHRNKVMRRLVGANRFHLPLLRFAEHFHFDPADAPAQGPWAAGRLKRPLRLIEAAFLRGAGLASVEGANVALLGWLSSRESMAESGAGPSPQMKFIEERRALWPLPQAAWEKFQPKLAGPPTPSN